MKIKALALSGAAALATVATGFTANAAVVDKPTFKVGGLVVVWGSDGTAGTDVVSDFYLLSSTSGDAGVDLIGGSDVDGDADTVITGDLVAVIDGDTVTQDSPTTGVLGSGAALSAFDVLATTDVDAMNDTSHSGRFYVASNTAFQIRATAAEVTNTMTGVDMSNILFDMDMDLTGNTASGLGFGAAAQDPAGAATGFVATVTDLDDLDPVTPVTVFTGTQRTAASVGNLAAQSVRFNTNYSLDADGDATADTSVDLSVGTGTLEAEVTYTIFTP